MIIPRELTIHQQTLNNSENLDSFRIRFNEAITLIINRYRRVYESIGVTQKMADHSMILLKSRTIDHGISFRWVDDPESPPDNNLSDFGDSIILIVPVHDDIISDFFDDPESTERYPNEIETIYKSAINWCGKHILN